MKNLKKIDFVNIIFFICCVVSDICYMFVPASEYITKTIASLVFVVCGMVNLIYIQKHTTDYPESPKFRWFMMIGLISACLGDIFLIDFFVIGVTFFALGHVFYFISFCGIQKVEIKDLFCGLAIFIPSLLLILFYKGFDFEGMQFLIIIYALIISCMVGKTISNLINQKSRKNLLLLCGSILFFLSDFMLLFRLFAGIGRYGSLLCVIFYYPAQFLLAWSIEVVSKRTTKE